MLDIYPSLMVIMLVIFFILLYQLNKKLYQPLLKFMDDRDAAIAKDMTAARQMGGDSGALQEKAEANLNEAKTTAAKLRQDTIEKSKQRTADAIAKKQEELEKKHEGFSEKLQKEKEALQTALLSQIPLVKESLKAKFSQL